MAMMQVFFCGRACGGSIELTVRVAEDEVSVLVDTVFDVEPRDRNMPRLWEGVQPVVYEAGTVAAGSCCGRDGESVVAYLMCATVL